MIEKNKKIIRSFYLDEDQIRLLEANGTDSVNKKIQEILTGYFNKEFYTSREKIIMQLKKIKAIVKVIGEKETIEQNDILLLMGQIETSIEEIQKNLNKL